MAWEDPMEDGLEGFDAKAKNAVVLNGNGLPCFLWVVSFCPSRYVEAQSYYMYS